jgi:copper chaperone CopZ
MKLLEWRVPGMITALDLAAVRTAVDQIHGVALIAANLATHQITIEYDPDNATPAEVAAYLATSGYPVEKAAVEF